MMKYLFLFLFCGLFINVCISQVFFDSTQKVNEWMNQYNVPALGIGIIRDGKIKSVKVHGNLSENEPAPTNTIFNVASLTKPVVAMLTLSLVNDGNWSLDEPIARYWTDPDVAGDPNAKLLTTRHILSHQTGFVNWRWLHSTKKLTFDNPPGTKFQYSGEGFEYLKKAIENKFRQPIEKLADSIIFKPLGMKDTRFTWKGIDESRFAKWHDKDKKLYDIQKRENASAADDLMTTIEDYSKFVIAVLNGFNLSKELYQQAISPQSTIKGNDFMGLGWELLTGFPNDQFAVVHSGSDMGVKTLAILLPKTREGLVIMTNSDNGSQLYHKLITELLSLGKEMMNRN